MKKTKSEKYLNDIDGNNFKEIKKLFYILLVIFVILVPIYIVLQLSSNKNNDVKIENKYNENKILATSVLEKIGEYYVIFYDYSDNNLSTLINNFRNKKNKIYEVNTKDALNKRYLVKDKKDVIIDKNNLKIKDNMLVKIKNNKVEGIIYDNDIQTRLK